MTFSPAIVYDDLATLDIATLAQTSAEGGDEKGRLPGGRPVQKSDHRHGRLLRARRKSVDLPTAAGIEDLDLQPHGASCRFQLAQGGLGCLRVGWIDEHGNTSHSRYQLA